MNTGSAGKLYTPELLGLATELARYPLTDDFRLIGAARSRTCGSTASLGLGLGEDGAIETVGLRVSACAIGQATAAIMARSIAGKRAEDMEAAQQAIASWLVGNAPLPDWPGIEAIEPALGYAGRHGAILLPWNAALDALSKANARG